MSYLLSFLISFQESSKYEDSSVHASPFAPKSHYQCRNLVFVYLINLLTKVVQSNRQIKRITCCRTFAGARPLIHIEECIFDYKYATLQIKISWTKIYIANIFSLTLFCEFLKVFSGMNLSNISKVFQVIPNIKWM